LTLLSRLSSVTAAFIQLRESKLANLDQSQQLLRRGNAIQQREGQRQLWTYWETATPPDFVKLCLETLQRHAGVGWKLNFITSANVKDYVSAEDLPTNFDKLQPSFKSDAVRLALLRRQGGAWIDATAIAVKDLDSWIQPEFNNGKKFVGFYIEHFTKGWPVVASWAMAVSEPEEPTIVRWHDAYLRLWQNRTDEDGISDDDFFKGVSLCCVDPLMRDYLNIELVLLALLQRDEAFSDNFMDHATLLKAEDGAYSVQAIMGLPWMTQNRCAPVRDPLSSLPASLQQALHTTPLLKLRHQDREWLVSMPKSALLGNPNSLIGSLLTPPDLKQDAKAFIQIGDGGACDADKDGNDGE
jgi:hypothetical protein